MPQHQGARVEVDRSLTVMMSNCQVLYDGIVWRFGAQSWKD